MRAGTLSLLLALTPAAADAEQLTAEAIEAMVIRLDQEDDASRASAESTWGVEIPDDTVFVLRRESLEQRGGMTLAEIEDLMTDLHRRGVPARWCQARCPTQGGDQRVTITSVLALPRDRFLVEVDVYGHNRFRDELWAPCSLQAWVHEVTIRLRKEQGALACGRARERANERPDRSRMSMMADLPPAPSPPARARTPRT